MYSIKTISNMTGVPPETLRTWERRFDFLAPARDSRGQRVYSDDDVTRVGLIASLANAGHPIRRLAALEIAELRDLGSQRTRIVRKPEEQKLVEDLAHAIGDLDLRRFRFLIGYALSLQSPVETVEHILAPTWRTIGELWENKSINVGVEHALSSIFKEELFAAIRTLHLAAHGPTIVFTTPSGELHEIGLLMGCYIAAAEGFECQYWGPNLPADDLVESLSGVGARALVISIVHRGTNDHLIEELNIIADRLPKSVAFWIGASSAVAKSLQPLPSRAMHFDRFEPFQQCLRALN